MKTLLPLILLIASAVACAPQRRQSESELRTDAVATGVPSLTVPRTCVDGDWKLELKGSKLNMTPPSGVVSRFSLKLDGEFGSPVKENETDDVVCSTARPDRVEHFTFFVRRTQIVLVDVGPSGTPTSTVYDITGIELVQPEPAPAPTFATAKFCESVQIALGMDDHWLHFSKPGTDEWISLELKREGANGSPLKQEKNIASCTARSESSVLNAFFQIQVRETQVVYTTLHPTAVSKPIVFDLVGTKLVGPESLGIH